MHTFKILQHNVHTLTFRRKNELYNTYAEINPDIILLNSTGTSDNNRIKFYTYNVYQKNKNSEPSAGVAIAIKQNIKHRILDEFSENMLAVELDSTQGKIIIATAYYPPRQPYLNYNDFNMIMGKKVPVYFLGDLNARHPSLGHNNTNAMGVAINNMTRRNIVTHLGPEFPTLINHQGTGTPDIILGNRNCHLNKTISRGPLTSSDHYPIILKVSFSPITIQVKERYQFRKADWVKFRETLETNPINSICDETIIKDKNFIDNNISLWYQNIQAAINTSIPKSSYKTLPHPQQSALLRQLKWAAQQLEAQANTPTGWSTDIRRDLISVRQEILLESSNLANAHWAKLIDKIKIDQNNPQKFWSQIKKLQGNNEPKTSYIKDNNNQKIFDDNNQEEAFRMHWQNTFKITPQENQDFDQQHEVFINNIINNNLETLSPFPMADLSRLDPENELLNPIRPCDIKLILKEIKNRAPGISGINKEIMDNLPNQTLLEYATLLNLTLSMGYFPDIFKIALLIFLLKPNKSPFNVANYRPISLLEVPGKIYEKILNKRLVKHLEDHNFTNINQYGFRKGRGTVIALATLYERIAITQSKRHQCNIVCRDISRAFDKVWYEGLKYHLLNINLPDLSIKIYSSFIDNRYAKIRINNYVGPCFPLQSGVPQGSCLSPQLFNLYTHKIPDPIPGCYRVIFADDVTHIVTDPGKSKQRLAFKTEREIQSVTDFEKKWKIRTNPTKFEILSISATKPTNIHINGQEINFAKTVTSLGLKIGSRGFSQHITEKAKRGKATLNKLNRFKKLPINLKLRLYKTLVRPIMEYPCIPACITRKSNVKKLQVVQNSALRRAVGESPPYHTTIEVLHNQFNIQPINVRLHKLAQSNWAKLTQINETLVQESRELNQVDHTIEHAWWRCLQPILERDPPPPIFTSGD